MDEFIKKLIERLEEEKEKIEPYLSGFTKDMAANQIIGLNAAIKVATHLAEEYNNGWIPCKKELPPQPKENPLFENKPLELYLVTIKNQDYPFRAFWNGKVFTDGWGKVNAIAWQPLPEPYKPKGESL